MPYIIKTSIIIHSTEKGVLLGILTKEDKAKYDLGEEPEPKFKFWTSKKLCQSDADEFLIPEVWIGDLEWSNRFIYDVSVGNNEVEERSKECSYKDFLVTASMQDLDFIAVDVKDQKKERKRFKKEEPKQDSTQKKESTFNDIPF